MSQALISGSLGIEAGGQLLADLHRRLHELPPRLTPESIVRILHLGLHPDNVILSQRGSVVIDWRNATEGPPDLDLALSALILAEVAVDEEHDLAAEADTLLTAFLQCASGDPLRMVDRAVAIRRSNPTLTAEEVGRLVLAAARIRYSR